MPDGRRRDRGRCRGRRRRRPGLIAQEGCWCSIPVVSTRQLIARRVPRTRCLPELLRHHISLELSPEPEPTGIILSGGPASVYVPTTLPVLRAELLELGIPVLRICYGMQVTLGPSPRGGRVEEAESAVRRSRLTVSNPVGRAASRGSVLDPPRPCSSLPSSWRSPPQRLARGRRRTPPLFSSGRPRHYGQDTDPLFLTGVRLRSTASVKPPLDRRGPNRTYPCPS